MAMEYEFTAIATLRMLVKGTVLNKFGGLIFVKKTSQIFDLSDIVGKIVTAVSIQLCVLLDDPTIMISS